MRAALAAVLFVMAAGSQAQYECQGRPWQKITSRTPPSQAPFELFKFALENGSDQGAEIAKTMAKPAEAEAMRRHAEAQCQQGNKAACSVVHCAGGDENFGVKDYYSRKCAETTGRAFGAGWMEWRAGCRREEQGHQLIPVSCLY